MSVMFEVYYRAPTDEERERNLSRTIEGFGGRLDFREPADRPNGAIVLTFEFNDWDCAEEAARVLRERGEHVEGPQEYAA